MSKNYKHLNHKDRDRIFELLRQGKTQKEIGSIIGRHKSTISREISRNRHKKLKIYLPDTAEKKAAKRKIKGRKKNYLEKDPELRKYVIKRLNDDWSPEQIEGKIREETGKYFNYESIYQYIYSLSGRKQNLKSLLKRSHRIRRKNRGRKISKSRIPNRVDIDLRPKIVKNGLIRWYLPRSTDLNSLTDKQIHDIMELINNRPRKCLNFKTPKKVFIDEMNKIYRSKYNTEFNLFNFSCT